MIIDGKRLAGEIIERLKKQGTPKQIFAAILVGDDPNSISFIKRKGETAKALGIDFQVSTFPVTITDGELHDAVSKLANDTSVGGVLIQLPLPGKLNRHFVLDAIPSQKDVDVLGEYALGMLYAGTNKIIPPGAGAVKEILESLKCKVQSYKVAIIGAGILIGRPVSLWLQDQAEELAVFTKNTKDMNKKLKNFDLIISGVGKGYLFSASDLKDDAIVIDFGYDKINGKFVGDFDPRKAPDTMKYTPTPGGTGPVLVAALFENFYTLTKE